MAVAESRSVRQLEVSGLRIAFEEYGDPEGAPVFFCHGWPSSRGQAALAAASAANLGIRLVSLDRPGIARSSRQPERTLLMWPPLLSAVADRLGIDRCFVLGVSGGAPYALVSAWAMPERVCGAAVVCGAPPLADVEPQNIFAVYRLLLRLYRWRRGAVRLALRQAKPFMSLRLPGWARRGLLQVLTPPDAEVLRDPRTFDLCFENFREAWLGEADGVFHDAEIYAQPWAFPLGEIRVPVAIWHGKQDRNFSWRLAEEVTAAIPSAVGHFVENEGHFSLPIRRSSEILRDLMESDSLPFQSAGRMTSLS